MRTRARYALVMSFVLLAIALLLVGTKNAAADEEGGFLFEVIDEKATVTGYVGAGGEVAIPEALAGYPTTTIGVGAFYSNPWITDVVIPGTVTYIGYWAFSNCSSLASVSVRGENTRLGDYSFDHCSALASVSIEGGSIGTFAFWRCVYLSSISLGNSVTTIGNYAFWECTTLAWVDIPENVTSIGTAAFYSCSSLRSVTIPDNVTEMGSHVFWDCSSMTYVSIGGGVTSIGSGAFRSCTSLTSVSIPDSVTDIGHSAFFMCSSLSSITVPDSVRSIGQNAFSLCASLTSVSIGNGVTTIGIGAFSYCTSLFSVRMGGSIAYISGDAFSYCTSLSSIAIPASVTYIASGAFSYCTSLYSMTFFGLEAPFVGWRWIEETPAMMRGHAYAASNFPISGGIFYELTMGDYIPTGPNAPLRLSSITEETSVTISWVAPLYDGGSPILSYRVYQSSRSTGEYVLIATPSVTQHVQSGLVSGQTYWFKISAVNSLGEGASSVPLSTTPGTASAPRNITASWRSDGILITWEAPASMGGGNITTFKVYRSMGTGSELMATLGPSSFSFLDCNATATNAHSYHVVATNALGDGASSATVSVAPQNPGGTDQSILPISVAVAIIAALVLVVWLRRRR